MPIFASATVAPYVRRLLAAPHTQVRDALARAPRKVEVTAVDRPLTLGRGKNAMVLTVVEPCSHAEGMLMAYLPGQKLGWVVDVWSPGFDWRLDLQRDFVRAVVRAGIPGDARFAGGHGGAAPIANLLALWPDEARGR